MPNPDSRPGGTLNQLLEVMPSIAEAANAFTSEENQRSALAALLHALGLPDQPSAATGANLSAVPPLPGNYGEDHPEGGSGGTPEGQSGSPRRRVRKPTVKKPWARAQDINFRPAGKEALRDLAAAKSPATFEEKNLVVVYYLEDVLGITPISVGHVLAGYQECGWKAPADPYKALSKTARAKGWLDTSDMAAIRVIHGGRNTIEHDMPRNGNKSA